MQKGHNGPVPCGCQGYPTFCHSFLQIQVFPSKDSKPIAGLGFTTSDQHIDHKMENSLNKRHCSSAESSNNQEQKESIPLHTQNLKKEKNHKPSGKYFDKDTRCTEDLCRRCWCCSPFLAELALHLEWQWPRDQGRFCPHLEPDRRTLLLTIPTQTSRWSIACQNKALLGGLNPLNHEK